MSIYPLHGRSDGAAEENENTDKSAVITGQHEDPKRKTLGPFSASLCDPHDLHPLLQLSVLRLLKVLAQLQIRYV